MDRAVFDEATVDFEREQIPDHLQPWTALAGLAFVIGGRIDEVQLRPIHQHPADDAMMEQSIPLNGKIKLSCRKKRYRDIARPFADADIVDGIGPAPEMNSHETDGAGVEFIAIERAINVASDAPRKNGPGHPGQHGDDQNDDQKAPPAPVAATRLSRGVRRRFITVFGRALRTRVPMAMLHRNEFYAGTIGLVR